MCENGDDGSYDRENLSETDQRIRELNDTLRRTFMGGHVVMTQGFSGLPSSTKAKAIAAIRSFDGFNEDCDPYGTHEFGTVEVDGETVWFKVDTYDLDLLYHSPDASDPKVTKRVMTLLLPSEY